MKKGTLRSLSASSNAQLLIKAICPFPGADLAQQLANHAVVYLDQLEVVTHNLS